MPYGLPIRIHLIQSSIGNNPSMIVRMQPIAVRPMITKIPKHVQAKLEMWFLHLIWIEIKTIRVSVTMHQNPRPLVSMVMGQPY